MVKLGSDGVYWRNDTFARLNIRRDARIDEVSAYLSDMYTTS